MKKSVLDDEEKAILESYESGEWVSVKDTKKEINKLQQCAKNTLSQNKRISIRMTSKDFVQVQLIAVQEGIPLSYSRVEHYPQVCFGFSCREKKGLTKLYLSLQSPL